LHRSKRIFPWQGVIPGSRAAPGLRAAPGSRAPFARQGWQKRGWGGPLLGLHMLHSCHHWTQGGRGVAPIFIPTRTGPRFACTICTRTGAAGGSPLPFARGPPPLCAHDEWGTRRKGPQVNGGRKQGGEGGGAPMAHTRRGRAPPRLRPIRMSSLRAKVGGANGTRSKRGVVGNRTVCVPLVLCMWRTGTGGKEGYAGNGREGRRTNGRCTLARWGRGGNASCTPPFAYPVCAQREGGVDGTRRMVQFA